MSHTPTHEESKYYKWEMRKVFIMDLVFLNDKSNIINNDNNNFSLGWLLDFRTILDDKSSSLFNVNHKSATYAQDNNLKRDLALVT